MTEVFVVTNGSMNRASAFQFAFHDLEEAKKCRDLLDYGKGADCAFNTIHVLQVFDTCDQLMRKKDES